MTLYLQTRQQLYLNSVIYMGIKQHENKTIIFFQEAAFQNGWKREERGKYDQRAKLTSWNYQRIQNYESARKQICKHKRSLSYWILYSSHTLYYQTCIWYLPIIFNVFLIQLPLHLSLSILSTFLEKCTVCFTAISFTEDMKIICSDSVSMNHYSKQIL